MPKCSRSMRPATRARRHAVRHARAVLPRRPDRAVHAADHRGRHPRVVAAMQDPNPLVSGRGFAELRAPASQVEVGCCDDEARAAQSRVLHRPDRGPADGHRQGGDQPRRRDRRRAGVRTRLTSREANRRTQRLRAAVDAIGVGSGRAGRRSAADGARLLRPRPLTRVVFDRRCARPAAARLFSTLDAGPVIIVRNGGRDRQAHPERRLPRGGRRDARRGAGAAGRAARAGAFDISTLLLEGGAALHAAAWRAGLVDRVHVIVAPTRWARRREVVRRHRHARCPS